MNLMEALHIERGVTAVIGSGGKTTLLHTLAAQLSVQGTVILTTSTHMRPSETYPCLYAPTAEEISAFFQKNTKSCHPEHSEESACEDAKAYPVLCVGTLTEEGKFTACDTVDFETLATLADYVLVEADGSKMLPLKAHAAHEPVIPPNANRTVCVVGASGLGKPIREVVHRYELFCSAVGATPAERATPVFVAWLLNMENLADIYYVNQCDLPEVQPAVRELADLLCKPVVCGSLWEERQ